MTQGKTHRLPRDREKQCDRPWAVSGCVCFQGGEFSGGWTLTIQGMRRRVCRGPYSTPREGVGGCLCTGEVIDKEGTAMTRLETRHLLYNRPLAFTGLSKQGPTSLTSPGAQAWTKTSSVPRKDFLSLQRDQQTACNSQAFASGQRAPAGSNTTMPRRS